MKLVPWQVWQSGNPLAAFAAVPWGCGAGGNGDPPRRVAGRLVVAHGAVEASGRLPRGGGGRRVVRRVVRRSRVVALCTNRCVRRVRVRVGVRGSAPRFGCVRSVHPVAGEAGDLRAVAGEVVPVADLAGGEPGAARGLLGGRAVHGGGGPVRDRVVVAACRVSEAGPLVGVR